MSRPASIRRGRGVTGSGPERTLDEVAVRVAGAVQSRYGPMRAEGYQSPLLVARTPVGIPGTLAPWRASAFHPCTGVVLGLAWTADFPGRSRDRPGRLRAARESCACHLGAEATQFFAGHG